MSLIIENGKVIKATGNANQIVADFNEYLKFIRETTIPVPKDQFTSLNENRAKLYSDHVEAIKANKDLQEQLNELQKVYDEVCTSKEKLRIENSKIFRERDILQRECKELNEKCNELQKACDDVDKLREELHNVKCMHAASLKNIDDASTVISQRASEIEDLKYELSLQQEALDKLREENEELEKKVSLYKCIEETRKCIKEAKSAELRHQYDHDLYRLLSVLSSIDEEDAKDKKSSKDVNSINDAVKEFTKKVTKIASIEDTEAKQKWEEEQEELEKLGAEIYAENQKAAKNRHSSLLSDDDIEVDKNSEDEEANNDLSSKPVKVYDNSSPYKTGDLAFIIERSCADPTDDSTIVAHVTLAMYTGVIWHSLDMHPIETDFADIALIQNAEYLKEYFGRENVTSAVKFHY